MKICLDPGHGGRDNGASTHAILEDAMALEFAGRLGHHLRALGAETLLTRTEDVAVGLTTRAAMAVNARCGLFLAIHCNASTNTGADGAEAFYAPPGRFVDASQTVASKLLRECVALGLHSRGVKPDCASQHPSLTVLRNTCQHMPAVLLEIGFVTNTHDAKLMADAQWRERLAAAMARAIVGK